MKELGLNPKDYMHVSSDDKSTTLRHKKGHLLTIAHNVLSPKMQTALKALAAVSQKDDPQEQQEATGGYVKEIHTDENEPGYTKMASGGHVDTYAMGLPCLNTNCKSHGKPHPNCRCYGMAKGGEVNKVHYCAYGKPHKPDCAYYRGGEVDGGSKDRPEFAAKGGKPIPQDSPAIMSCRQPFQSGGTASGRVPTSGSGSVTMANVGGGRESYPVYTAENLPPTEHTVRSKTSPEQQQQAQNQRMQQYKAQDIANRPAPESSEDAGYTTYANPAQNEAEGGEIRKMYADGDEVQPFWERSEEKPRDIAEVPKEKPTGGVTSQDIYDDAYKQLKQNSPGDPDEDIQRRAIDITKTRLADQEPAANRAFNSMTTQDPAAQQQRIDDLNAKRAEINLPPLPGGTPPQQTAATAPPPLPEPTSSVPPAPPTPASTQGSYQPLPNPLQQSPAPQYKSYGDFVAQTMKEEDEAFKNDLFNGHITPKTYENAFGDKNTLGKIGTFFGLLLSGAGSGLSHQPNALLTMMNNAIQNDLEAQKQSKSNAQNFLSMSQDHEMNQANVRSLDAETNIKSLAAAQQRMNWAAFHKLVTQANSLAPGSVQRQKADAQLAMMYPLVQQGNFDIADKAAAAAAVLNYGQQGPATGQQTPQGNEAAFQARQRALNYSGQTGIAKYEADRHIPYVDGQSSDSIPQPTKDKIGAMNTLDNQLNNLLTSVNQYEAMSLRGNLDPKVLGPMAVKAHEAAALYNQTLDGLGMTEGRMDWLGKQIPSNPQTAMERLKGSKEKLEEVMRNNRMRRDQQLKDIGYNAPGVSAQPTKQQTKMINGSQYVKVPGGWQKIK